MDRVSFRVYVDSLLAKYEENDKKLVSIIKNKIEMTLDISKKVSLDEGLVAYIIVNEVEKYNNEKIHEKEILSSENVCLKSLTKDN